MKEEAIDNEEKNNNKDLVPDFSLLAPLIVDVKEKRKPNTISIREVETLVANKRYRPYKTSPLERVQFMGDIEMLTDEFYRVIQYNGGDYERHVADSISAYFLYGVDAIDICIDRQYSFPAFWRCISSIEILFDMNTMKRQKMEDGEEIYRSYMYLPVDGVRIVEDLLVDYHNSGHSHYKIMDESVVPDRKPIKHLFAGKEPELEEEEILIDEHEDYNVVEMQPFNEADYAAPEGGFIYDEMRLPNTISVDEAMILIEAGRYAPEYEHSQLTRYEFVGTRNDLLDKIDEIIKYCDVVPGEINLMEGIMDVIVGKLTLKKARRRRYLDKSPFYTIMNVLDHFFEYTHMKRTNDRFFKMFMFRPSDGFRIVGDLETDYLKSKTKDDLRKIIEEDRNLIKARMVQDSMRRLESEEFDYEYGEEAEDEELYEYEDEQGEYEEGEEEGAEEPQNAEEDEEAIEDEEEDVENEEEEEEGEYEYEDEQQEEEEYYAADEEEQQMDMSDAEHSVIVLEDYSEVDMV